MRFKTLTMTALLLMAGIGQAQAFNAGNLSIERPWSQELPPNAPSVAAYFVIHNNGKQDDRLLSVDSPVAGKAELHGHANQNGMMSMRMVPSVSVPAGGEATFAPMGNHVMLMELKSREQLVDGGQFPLTLHFEKAGDVTVQVNVHKQPPAGADQMHMP